MQRQIDLILALFLRLKIIHYPIEANRVNWYKTRCESTCPLNLKVQDEWTPHPLWFLLHQLPCTSGVQSLVLLSGNKNPRLQVFSHTFLPTSLFTQGLLVI